MKPLTRFVIFCNRRIEIINLKYMGQKVNPKGLRLGISSTWDSRWYVHGEDYANKLHQDLEIKKVCK